mmetsp:Transcript_19110/g.30394  ORF Transcript_19110/g.30394 Transcript_19110/m.30394 type:complete len:199 (-) Transcript_19110:192-788(-)|eukprot:jgi/Bigna1/84790/estExt_fgenesh1_pg.C_10065
MSFGAETNPILSFLSVVVMCSFGSSQSLMASNNVVPDTFPSHHSSVLLRMISQQVSTLRGGSQRYATVQQSIEDDFEQNENEEDVLALILPMPDGYDPKTGQPVYTRDPGCWPIFIENMKFYTSDLTLVNLLSDAGVVLEIKFIEDPRGGMSFGKAIVWFRTIGEREKALKFDGTILDGNPISVCRPTAQSWSRMCGY